MPNIPARLIETLKTAQNVIAFTGAGTSAESGIPTFRDAQTGIWEQFRPEDLATPQAFERNPQRVWDWYQWRRSLVEQAAPNPGHLALAKLEHDFASLTVVTQNVDGLHQRAGNQSVIELHGSIRRYICSHTRMPVAEDWVTDSEARPPPSPHDAAGLTRPAVVWFGEMLPEDALRGAFEVSKTADVIFSIGTSSVVEPAASLPLFAKDHGAVVVEINPQVTPLTRIADFVLPGPSGEILPELLESLRDDP